MPAIGARLLYLIRLFLPLKPARKKNTFAITTAMSGMKVVSLVCAQIRVVFMGRDELLNNYYDDSGLKRMLSQ